MFIEPLDFTFRAICCTSSLVLSIFKCIVVISQTGATRQCPKTTNSSRQRRGGAASTNKSTGTPTQQQQWPRRQPIIPTKLSRQINNVILSKHIQPIQCRHIRYDNQGWLSFGNFAFLTKGRMALKVRLRIIVQVEAHEGW